MYNVCTSTQVWFSKCSISYSLLHVHVTVHHECIGIQPDPLLLHFMWAWAWWKLYANISHPSDNGQQKYIISMRPWESKVYDKRPKFSHGLPSGTVKTSHICSCSLSDEMDDHALTLFDENGLKPTRGAYFHDCCTYQCDQPLIAAQQSLSPWHMYRVSPNYSSFSDHF